MQYQPEIHTIIRNAPPSYSEATGQSVLTGDNQPVSRSDQSTHEHGRTQMPDNPPYPTYQQPNNFYSNDQSAYNPVYVVGQENQPSTTHHIQCRRKNKNKGYGSCRKTWLMYLVCLIISIILIKLVVFQFI